MEENTQNSSFLCTDNHDSQDTNCLSPLSFTTNPVNSEQAVQSVQKRELLLTVEVLSPRKPCSAV